jgi:uncharacterized cupin superfamily protein
MDTEKYIVESKYIEEMEGEKIVHFLNANAERINKSLGDETGLNHIGVHIIYVEPGKETTEYHKHYYEEECFYILSGRGTAIIEGDKYPVGKGDFIGLPRNEAAHNIINDGNETLVCLVMGQRLEQDIVDYPNKKKRLYRNSGNYDLVNLSEIEKLK